MTSEMKDSGVELNQKEMKLRYLVELRNSKRKMSSCDKYIGMENIEAHTGKYIPSELAVDEAEQSEFISGDVLFGKLRPYLEKAWLATFSGLSSSEFLIFKNSKLYPRFLYWSLFSDEFVKNVDSSTYGAKMPRASWEFIKNIYLYVPNQSEQICIADFLDKKTAQIDKAHDLLTRQIETLKNYRKSLIYEAVTKGLDTKVKLKPSGVDWIGDVPCGWEVSKLKYLTVGKLQYGANAEGVDFSENLPRYIRITDISQDNNLKIDGKQSLPLEISAPYILNDGDILFARSGATVGKTFLYTEECGKAAFAGYLIRANFDKNKVISKFIYYTTLGQGYENWKNSIFSQSTIQNIGADKYSELWIAIPNYREQQGITSFLDKKTSKVDEIIQNKQQQIQNLDKQRKTLIYDYVTGKKRVK